MPRPEAHLAIVGATASGKSAVALEIGRRLAPDVELVSIDSMQVYRGMDIGTAKPAPDEREEVAHHLLDLADPSEEFSVAQFQAAFTAAIAGIEARDHTAVLVGGTGLYHRAVVDGLTIPGAWPEVRAALEAEADTGALHARLAALDPLAASRMEPANRRRIVRALEVTLGSGRPFSSFGPGLEAYAPSPYALVGLRVPRHVLAARIEERFRRMIAKGLVEEVRTLLASHPAGLSRTARQALGYREILGHVEDGEPLEACIEEAIRRTRAFAVRQERWFRRDPRIRWYDAGDNPLAVVDDLLGDWMPGCRT
ncbi:MAG TPA: tRNA (adenosine(37)-N6)-dimethylallyltransferase MiaA [Acidimicrobiales bacterium]|nr:tRNA (adenosine(37)-N6)-dimethylallyltransferase MiaA [Acidimicrobiales bacterium]